VSVASSLTGITTSSLREQALRSIRTGIMTGEIVAGDMYSVPGLSARLGVSATPVREAMLDLVNEGLVVPVRNRGFRVVSLSVKDHEDILRLRLLLEVPSMGDVAESHRGDHLPEFQILAVQTQDHVRAGDLVAYLDADREFHLGLLGLLNNSRLVDIVGMLRNQSRLYDVGKLAERGQLLENAREHSRIVDAIGSGDRRQTEALMTQHLLRTRKGWSADGDDPSLHRQPPAE
jgi:DNA-binding GntR family transcriptional regulator